MGGDHFLPEQVPGQRAGQRCEVQRGVHLTGGGWIQRDHARRGEHRGQRGDGGAGPVPVRHVIEEVQHRPEVVGPGAGQAAHPPPEQIRRPVQPWVVHLVRMQGAGDQAGGDQRSRCPRLGHPPGGVRPAVNGGIDEHGTALGRGMRGQPVARRHGQRAVPGVGIVQHMQPELDGQWLAARAPPVRLQRLAEPAVGIAVGGHRRLDRFRPAAAENPLEPAPFQHPCVRSQELRGRIKVRHAHGFYPSTSGRDTGSRSAVCLDRYITD